MGEVLRSNDVALISAVEGLLQAADIPHQVADRHASVLDGSIQVIQIRVLVPDERTDEAKQLLTEAGLI
jgi:hypothetical protein